MLLGRKYDRTRRGNTGTKWIQINLFIENYEIAQKDNQTSKKMDKQYLKKRKTGSITYSDAQKKIETVRWSQSIAKYSRLLVEIQEIYCNKILNIFIYSIKI